MSAAIDTAVANLRAANEELEAARSEADFIEQTRATSSERVAAATNAFNDARITLAEVAVQPE